MLQQINDQDWPDIVARRCEGKHMGVFATRDIEAGSLLCDYHGTLLDDQEGERRYNAYGDTEDNVYMYKIEGSTVHWIDAVVPCSCYPNKKLKGRLLNCDRLHPNVIAKTKFLNERPHVLLYAKRNIKKREELMFDYGCFKDRFSSQQSWM